MKAYEAERNRNEQEEQKFVQAMKAPKKGGSVYGAGRKSFKGASTANLDGLSDSDLGSTGEGGDRSSLKMDKGIDQKKLAQAGNPGQKSVIGERRLSQLGGIPLPKSGAGLA